MATLLAGFLSLAPIAESGAAGPALTHTANPSSVADGGTVDLTVTAPLYNAGTATRWLQEKIDPDKVHLTSLSQIKVPEGWKVKFSSDGSSFTDIPPSTSQGWSAVRYVRAEGSFASTGIVKGQQAMTTTETFKGADTPGSFPGSSSGDGYDAAFNGAGQVFNVNHHSYPLMIECHEIADGSTCPGNWPMTLSVPGNVVKSPNTSALTFDPKHSHLWFPIEVNGKAPNIFDNVGNGMICIDISRTSAPGLCGGDISTAQVKLGLGRSSFLTDNETAFTRIAGRVYYYDRLATRLNCLDMEANGGAGAPCPNQPYELTNTRWWGSAGAYPFMPWPATIALGSRVVVATGTGLFCIDDVTHSTCAGWSSPLALDWFGTGALVSQPIFAYPELDASGHRTAACFLTWDRLNLSNVVSKCVDTAGRLLVPEPSYIDFFAKVGPGLSETSAVVGTRIITASNTYGTLVCFDAKVRGGCEGWNPPSEAQSKDVYTLTSDPDNPSCIFEVTDQNGIRLIDATTGALGCPKAAPSTVKLTASTPTLGCASGATAWSDVTVSSPVLGTGSGSSTATLSVSDSTGNPISGWQGVSVPATGVVDLSRLPMALTGQHPVMTVTVNGPSVTKITVSLTSLGNSPQLCISPTVSYTCPGGYDAVTTLPTSFADLLASDDTAPTPGSALRVSVKAPGLLSCRGAVSGTVLDTSGNPVPGVPVRITGPDGTPVQLNGSDYTTTTKASGTYHFIGLRAGVSYTVTFPDTSVATAVSSTVPDGDGAGTTTASGGSVTSNDAPVLVGATTVINALYTQLIDLVPDAEVVPKNTTTTLHPLANDEPATGNTLVTSSVKLCGPSEAPPACTQSSVTVTEGTFVVNPNGSVNFTPTTDFTGVVTPVTYQASDTGPTTGSAVINVTVVGAPTAQPVTSIDDVNVTQTLTPLSGATVDPAAGWASTPLLLCGALESTGSCTQSSVSVDGVGVYTVTQDNEVSFVPAHNYVGSPAPISFDVVDGIGQRASSTISVTVRPTIPEVPSSPSVTAGTTSATVSFDVPAWDGGSPVTSYLVEDGAGKHSCTVSVSGPGPYSCTVTGLHPGKTYGFVITATNAVGTGPEAAVSTRVGVLACTPGMHIEQRLGLLQSTTDFSSWTTLGQENGFVNAIAYRPADGFLYGIGTAARDLTGPENHLMRIAGDGSVTDLGVVEGLPGTRAEAKFPAGAFDPYSGHLVVGGRGHLYSIDVDTHRATQIPLPDGVSRIGWDLVIQGEWLWTVTSTQVVGINLSSDESVSYDLPAGYVSHGYGSVWSGSDDSSIFFQSNATGDITRVTGLGSTPSFSKVGNLPSAPRNDGASCPGAPG